MFALLLLACSSPEPTVDATAAAYLDSLDRDAPEAWWVADRPLQDLVVSVAVQSGARVLERADRGEFFFTNVIGDALDELRECPDATCMATVIRDVRDWEGAFVPPTGCSEGSMRGVDRTLAFGDYEGSCIVDDLVDGGLDVVDVQGRVTPESACVTNAEWSDAPEPPLEDLFCQPVPGTRGIEAFIGPIPTEVLGESAPLGEGPFIAEEVTCIHEDSLLGYGYVAAPAVGWFCIGGRL